MDPPLASVITIPVVALLLCTNAVNTAPARIPKNGFSKIIIDSQRFTCRQDAPDAYDVTTVAYVARPKYIMKCRNLFDGKVKSVLVPKERAIDIDDRYDFALAETIFRNNYSDV